MDIERTSEGKWAPGQSGNPATRFGQPQGNRPGRKPGRTLGDVLESIRTENGDLRAAQALYEVAADPSHPHWTQAQKILWSRTDGPVGKELRVHHEDNRITEIRMIHGSLDVPLPLADGREGLKPEE